MDLASLGRNAQLYPAARTDHGPKVRSTGVVPTCVGHAHETLLWASKGGGARHAFNYDLINSQDPGSQLSSVWRIPAVPMGEKSHGRHPTQKPLRLLRRAVLASTTEGELVFDPFCGSGTTGVAAKELGRFFVGAEKERGYAELAGRRMGPRRGKPCWGDSSPRKREPAARLAGHRREAAPGSSGHAMST